MTLTILPVTAGRDLRRFVTFPWRIYRTDPHWVPPLIEAQMDRLNTARNPFWRNAERALWLVERDSVPVGTIAAIIDRTHNRTLDETLGTFGFFECVDDQSVADLLLKTAADWLAERSMTAMRGPFNPSSTDEVGFLIEGFDTRPALLEAHTPAYYPALVESAGFKKHLDTMAWLVEVGPEPQDRAAVFPEKLIRVAERARARSGVRVRTIDMAHWDAEIGLAHRIFNAGLAHLPANVPVPEAEFRAFAASFRPIMDPETTLVAEIAGRAVGFAVALPDLNEALQHVNGRLWPTGLLKLWWHRRHLHRTSFKILSVLPEYWGRGLESVLIVDTSRAFLAKGFREVDLSLTGEENTNIQRLLGGMGMKVYRRYRIYEKPIDHS